ncbi:unnamed protein product, partial [Amoebophrya sp. A25]
RERVRRGWRQKPGQVASARVWLCVCSLPCGTCGCSPLIFFAVCGCVVVWLPFCSASAQGCLSLGAVGWWARALCVYFWAALPEDTAPKISGGGLAGALGYFD